MSMNKNPTIVPALSGDPGEAMARISKLFDEVQAVKMLSLARIVQPGTEEGSTEGDGLKHSQMALKSIEIQLRILAELVKRPGGAELPIQFAVIWEIISNASHLKPIIGRSPVLDELITDLKEFAAACDRAGSQGADEDTETPLPASEL
jgi:hypothetical protein